MTNKDFKTQFTEILKTRLFEIVMSVSEDLKVKSYLVGGYVRDMILDRENVKKDIDILVIGDALSFAKETALRLNKKIKVQVFKNFGTAMFIHKGLQIEFVGARKESYQKNSRNPTVSSGTLLDDLSRRDFTINALAISLSKNTRGEFIDMFEGLNDIRERRIRTPLAASKTYSDDPLRMIRGIRFSNQLGFTIQKESFASMISNSHRIKILSNERIVDEFHKIMLCDKPSIGIQLMYDAKILEYIMPELVALKGVEEVDGQKHKENFIHTLEVVDNISEVTQNLWLRWAALLHDIGKPATKRFDEKTGWTFHSHEFIGSKMVYKIFKRLKMPLNEHMKYVQKLVLYSSRPIILAQDDVTDSAIRRFVFDLGDIVEDLLMLCESDITTKNEYKFNLYYNNFKIVRKKIKKVEEQDEIRNFKPPISGEEIMSTFKLKPSKEIGIIKEAVKEAILEGKISNNYEQSFEFMVTFGKNMGLDYNEK